MSTNGFMIAAPASGSGKTTVTLAIMAALARRGVTVAPFKCGPDFIDPGYHQAVTGQTSINLDAWMCSEEFVRATFQIRSARHTVAIIEGAMGLFDGFGSATMEGSSAQIAAMLGTRVVLVLNARGMAASAAAMIQGFAAFNPHVKIAGVIFNNVGSQSHADLLVEALATHCPEIACFGSIPRDETVVIPSRHLGLVTVGDNSLPDQFIRHLADVAEGCLDLEGLAALKIEDQRAVKPAFPHAALHCEAGDGAALRIAVARDQAFCFCYDDNLRLLTEAGAELVAFSPLGDLQLPADISGIYLPGGYPELHAEKLAANLSMRSAIKAAVEQGLPVYAECGGFMYLTEGMRDGIDFAGVFPVRATMLPKRKALGYREALLMQDTAIGKRGAVCRGHEFHYSEIDAMPPSVERCYRVSRRGETVATEGYRINNCLGSYIHLHFGSNPEIAVSFVRACRHAA